jgi:type IV pilus biogenesis protein CpaD/CtpE
MPERMRSSLVHVSVLVTIPRKVRFFVTALVLACLLGCAQNPEPFLSTVQEDVLARRPFDLSPSEDEPDAELQQDDAELLQTQEQAQPEDSPDGQDGVPLQP